MSSVLSFDIGIKNLAWCVTTFTGQQFRIDGWGNYNLLEGNATEAATSVVHCKQCSAKAKYENSLGIVCGKHIPSTHPLLKDLSGAVLTKVPGVADLKSILTAKGVLKLGKTKDALIDQLKTVASIPIPKKKVPHAAAIDVSQMHDAIRIFVTTQLQPFFQTLTEVRLENQPVLKNPVMKTIQILLFATLRDAIYQTRSPPPTFKLVHAGMKVKGKETGDKGYKARKEGSETRTVETLTQGKIHEATKWKDFFQQHKKRSDLADAFCMCLDAYSQSAYRNA